MTAGWDDLILKGTRLRGGPGAGMRACGKRILHLTADAVQTGEHLGGQAHHTGGFRHVAAHARMEIDPVAHRHVAHVLHAAHQTGLRIAGHDHPRRVVQRLHRRTAKTVDGDGRNRMRDLRQQGRVTGNVEALLQRLLDAAPVNIVQRCWVQRRVTRQQATHQVRGEIFRAHVTECAAF